MADSATGGTGVKVNDVTGLHRFRIDAVATTGSPTVTLTITLVGSITHPAGVITTKVDLLGPGNARRSTWWPTRWSRRRRT